MQNLFLKIVVLMGVVGGSCAIVWKAHESLHGIASSQLDPQQFVAIAETPSEPTKNNGLDRETGLDLAPVSDSGPSRQTSPAAETLELEPTLAKSPPPAADPFSESATQIGATRVEPVRRESDVEKSSPPSDFFADSESVRPEPRRMLKSTEPTATELLELAAAEPVVEKAPTQNDSDEVILGMGKSPSPAVMPKLESSNEESSNVASSEASDPFAAIAAMPANEPAQAPRLLPTLPEPEPLPLATNRSSPAMPLTLPTESKLPEQSEIDAKEAESMPVADLFSSISPAEMSSKPASLEPALEVNKSPAPALLPAQSEPETLLMSSSEVTQSRKTKSGVVNAGGEFTEDSRVVPASATVESASSDPFLVEQPKPASGSAVPGLMPLALPAQRNVMESPRALPASELADVSPNPGMIRSGTPHEPGRQALEMPAESLTIGKKIDEENPSFPSLAVIDPAKSPMESQPVKEELPPLPPATPLPLPKNNLPVPVQPAEDVLPEVLPEIVPSNIPVKPAVPAALPIVTPTPEKKLPEIPAMIPEQMEVLPDLKNDIPALPSTPPTVPERLPMPANVQPKPELPKSQVPPESLPVQRAPSMEPTTSNPALIGTAVPEPATASGQQSPELKIEKQAPAEAVIGEPVIYAIVIRNVGGSPARDVVVEDRIPKGTQLEGTIPQAYLNEGKLSWQLGTLAPGEERKIQLKVTPLESGQIGSVATVSFAAAVSASIMVSAPQLAISMSSRSEAVLGEHVTFQFKLQNRGQGTAKSVYLRAILPPGLKHPGGNDLEYEAGVLAPGAEKVIELIVTPEKEGTFTPVAQVSNDNKTHAETRADLHVIKARLELSRTGPENRFVGRPAPVLTRLTNHSAEKLTNVTVQEKLATSVELASVPRSGRWDPSKRLVTWVIPEIAPGETLELSSMLVASNGGNHQGTLIATDNAGNRVEIPTTLNVKGFAELKADVTATQRTVMLGERVSFRLTLKNVGTDAARNVRPRFVFPAGFAFANATGPTKYEIQGNAVEFEAIPELSVEAERVYEIALIANELGTSKVSIQLESSDYPDPLQSDQPVRVVANTP